MSALERDPVADLLRGVPFFSGLDRIDLARVLGALEKVRARAGEVIAEEGTEGRRALAARARAGTSPASSAPASPRTSSSCSARGDRGADLDDRQGTRIGAALTVVRFAAIAASVPVWKLRGLR